MTEVTVLLMYQQLGYLVSTDRLIAACYGDQAPKLDKFRVQQNIFAVKRKFNFPFEVFCKKRIGYALGIDSLDLDLAAIKVLYQLWSNFGNRLTKEDIQIKVWPKMPDESTDSCLSVYISGIRTRLGTSQFRIEPFYTNAERLAGYALVDIKQQSNRTP